MILSILIPAFTVIYLKLPGYVREMGQKSRARSSIKNVVKYDDL